MRRDGLVYSPTVRRRRLSNALKQFREAANMDSKEAAKRLGWQPSKVTRIERDEWRRPTVNDVMDLLDIYEVTDEATCNAMITLARESRRRGWWEEEYKDILGGALVGLEWEANDIEAFELALIPGLLQTADYATAVFKGGRVSEPAPIQRMVEARLARQRILTRENPPMFWAVIDEAALRKHVGGPAVMREQLHHLCRMAERPNIGIQVLLDTVGAHTAMTCGFTILDYEAPEDPTIIYVEAGAAGDLFLEKPEAVAAYRDSYGYLRASALSVEASAAYIEGLAKQLK
ncbi:helix-turn-helix transcriptional regulator [Spongiactinospora sp. TRM90649]|uniref:helix-turn-helix domain-containing protein n=1 Tax=Spongiactinospora sp. TRM90649 TaxID=3031114 RepID=UPI0023F99917|nr:helix-turn-helix transcriptional regulator [Spongiactinospora sp. TRM90649]MDF5758782.1 helix-turn-helix transcriptional regulator [Spongiactinospora sp. TRM90649]